MIADNELWGGFYMFDKKIKLEVSREELHLIKLALMEYRNNQIKNGKSTDFVNEVLEKILKK